MLAGGSTQFEHPAAYPLENPQSYSHGSRATQIHNRFGYGPEKRQLASLIEPAEDNLRGAKAWALAYGSIYIGYIYRLYMGVIRDILYNIDAI